MIDYSIVLIYISNLMLDNDNLTMILVINQYDLNKAKNKIKT